MEPVLHQAHCFRGPCDHIVDVAGNVICAQESEIVAGLPQEPHEKCISPGGSRGETGLNYSSRNPNIGISANPNVRGGAKFQESHSALLVCKRGDGVQKGEIQRLQKRTPQLFHPFLSPCILHAFKETGCDTEEKVAFVQCDSF